MQLHYFSESFSPNREAASLGWRDEDSRTKRRRRESSRTGGRICDWEMMLLGRLFCRLSVVISAQVTWNPVMRWWAAILDTRHRKLPVMFPSLMEKEAVRFSGLAKTFGCSGAVQRGRRVRGEAVDTRTHEQKVHVNS